jgi:replicative DNA helicase
MREPRNLNTFMEQGKLPPQAPEIEQAILGSMLIDCTRSMSEVGDLLLPEAFYVHAHSIIFSAIRVMYDRGEVVDLLTVTHHLKKQNDLDMVGGPFYISQLTNKVCSHRHIHGHALIVLEQFIARETIRLNSEAMANAYEGGDVFDLIPDTVAKMEASIAQSIRRRATRYAEAEANQLEELSKPKVAKHTTGFQALDRVLGGFHAGNLVIIAGRPGMGKSSFAFSCASEAAEQGHPTGLFSLELNEAQGQARLFSRREKVPLANIVNGNMTPEQIQKRHTGLAGSGELPLWIRYDTGLTLADIKAEIVRLMRNHGVRCFVIDQLNWVTLPKAQDRNAAVGELTRGLKMIALQLDVAIVLLSQLSRSVETRGGEKRPQLSDLRDSGNIEQDAQVVLFPYRPEYYGITEDDHGSTIGLMEVIVAKNTNGPLETVRLWFDPPTASVRENIERMESHFDVTGPFRNQDEPIEKAPF